MRHWRCHSTTASWRVVVHVDSRSGFWSAESDINKYVNLNAVLKGHIEGECALLNSKKTLCHFCRSFRNIVFKIWYMHPEPPREWPVPVNFPGSGNGNVNHESLIFRVSPFGWSCPSVLLSKKNVFESRVLASKNTKFSAHGPTMVGRGDHLQDDLGSTSLLDCLSWVWPARGVW